MMTPQMEVALGTAALMLQKGHTIVMAILLYSASTGTGNMSLPVAQRIPVMAGYVTAKVDAGLVSLNVVGPSKYAMGSSMKPADLMQRLWRLII